MKTYVIAEAGVNHNGNFEMAKELIDVALECGANAVKFQTFTPEEVIKKGTPKCDYQIEQTGQEEDQFDLIKNLHIPYDKKKELFEYGRSKGIEVLSTPFDLPSLDFLIDLKIPVLKIASGEITNPLLLLNAAISDLPIILSTGMSTLKDIESALEVIAFGYLFNGEKVPSLDEFRKAYCSNEGQALLKEKVTLLHCTTNYPAPFESLNLNAIDTMANAFHLKVGYSDHSKGHLASCIAVAKGATIIEKHFTLDNNLPGPDHMASLNPQDLKELIVNINKTELSLGRSEKFPSHDEIATGKLVRRSIVAGVDIKSGEKFSVSNLKVKRPGTGISPFSYWELLGKTATKDYIADDFIED